MVSRGSLAPRSHILGNQNDGGLMKIRFFGILALALAVSVPAAAGDLVGRWTAEFDSPIGVQKYVYEFKKSADVLAGEATYDHSLGKGTVPLSDLKVEGDKVSFNEPLTIDGNQITITYSGTLTGDELKLTRNVGDFGSEQLTAKRAGAAPAK
jgi:hypothetical protein